MNDEEKNSEYRPGYGYGDLNATNKEKVKDLVRRIEVALDLIKDDPKLEKEMDEIPRLNYLLECIKSTLESYKK